MATFNKVSYKNASPRGGGDNRLNSIPAKAKHVNDVVDRLNDGNYKRTFNYESIITATKAVTAADSGTVYGFNKADGIVVTLPTPAAGLQFTFLVETTFTTAGRIRTATTDGTDGFLGSITIYDTGANGAAGDRFNCQPAASNDFIDLGAIEQGWLTGGYITLLGLNATTYFVEGVLMGDGTLETVFEDA